MQQVVKTPAILECAGTADRRDELVEMGEMLDACQKSLSEYLDSKRNAFPRFFFISDDELLAVLGSSDPRGIVQYLMQLYNNVKKLAFSGDAKQVHGMSSSEGESFDFHRNTTVEGPVEQWMTQTDLDMKYSLHQIAKEGVFYYARKERIDWVKD